jgi:cobalt/nickel transport system permease protein
VHERSAVHALAPQCKIVAVLLFVVAVAATPARAVWAFGVYLCLLGAVGRAARVPARFVLRRLVFELPFVACALLLPFAGGGETVAAGPLSLSRDGLWAAWNVVAKATLGTIATVLLAATTPVAEVLRGLHALRVPRAFTSVASFMFRYADVVTGEARRMRIARESRGYAPRSLRQVPALAAATTALFLRSFERGERVYVAMLSRGYSGTLPPARVAETSSAAWAAALVLPATAAGIALVAA